MHSVLGFLNEKWHDDLLTAALENRDGAGLGDWKTYDREDFDRSSVGRWKALPPPIVSSLGRICNPLLEACGYEPVEIREADTAEKARRRYLFGLMLGKDRHGPHDE